MRVYKLVTLSLTWSLVGLAACTLSEEELGALSAPIINGIPVASGEHNEVVGLYSNGGLCSATLITTRVVATAAHCVKGQSASSLRVLFGNNITGVIGVTQVGVSEVWVHPNATMQGSGHFDIALLRLSRNPPSGVVPIPHLRGVNGVRQADVGLAMELVGFGQDSARQAGIKLKTPNNIMSVCETKGGCLLTSIGMPVPTQVICYDEDPGGVCQGDSGGPLFIKRDGKDFLAGVTSFGDSECKYVGCSTKVDAYELDIARFIGRILSAPCASPADCDSGHCVEGVCCESECPDICHTCSDALRPGTCVPKREGQSCGTGDMCVGGMICKSGKCVSAVAMDCRDNDPCTSDTCDPVTGCQHARSVDGSSCDNADPCDGHEVCISGICAAGTPPSCDDSNPCTYDSCVTGQGCVSQPSFEGSVCGGGSCGQGVCVAGKCALGGGHSLCDDGNPCTFDSCQNGSCTHGSLPDKSLCGECKSCLAGVCQPKPDCSPGNSSGCSISGGSVSSDIMFLGWATLLMGLFLRRRIRVHA